MTKLNEIDSSLRGIIAFTYRKW